MEAELKDFEIVPGENKKTTSSKTDKNLTTTTSSTLASVSATMGKEDWEQQMDELLDEDEDLKWINQQLLFYHYVKLIFF